MAEENPLETADNLNEESMEIVDESFDDQRVEESETVEEQPETSAEEEKTRKSNILKESFLEVFRNAATVKEVLPELRDFLSNEEVIEWDRKEVEMLVEIRIQEEKAKKKAEKAARKEQESAIIEKAPLSDVIRSATGLNVIGIVPPTGMDLIIPAAVPMMQAPVIPKIDLTGNITIKSIKRGKAGFSTPHPNEIPPELRHAKPDLVIPIPDDLRNFTSRIIEKKVAAIPNELLPPEQRVYDDIPIVFVRPPLRKTLFLAGARAGKRCDRIPPKKTPKEKRKRKNEYEREEKRPEKRERRESERREDRKKKAPSFMLSVINSLPNGLNKNSPLPVKRYHARQLANSTGISLEEAMKEIEEQCMAFGGEDSETAKEHDEMAMELIKKRGDEKWNQRYNYTPADHSAGIPGVDRPPAGVPKKDRPPPPPPGRGQYEDGELEDFGGNRKRSRPRGGQKERERKRRREEERFASQRGRGGGGRNRGRGGGQGYGRWDDYEQRGPGPRGYNDDYYGPGAPPYRREDDRYDDRYGYPDDQGYDDYYGRPAGYGHDYGHEGYDYQGNQDFSRDASYYQEDGGQYYNQYYGTTSAPSSSDVPPPPPPDSLPPPPPRL